MRLINNERHFKIVLCASRIPGTRAMREFLIWRSFQIRLQAARGDELGAGRQRCYSGRGSHVGRQRHRGPRGEISFPSDNSVSVLKTVFNYITDYLTRIYIVPYSKYHTSIIITDNNIYILAMKVGLTH